ncbi:hypothetical protein [Kangiella sp. TOML190]|uniref:hypothetical protein n=1 Tax=Kangiella sp. TOML190 TaxID=2931351 RepID=UPI00203C3202|nr:hypothetical protein [Kangiella sp. TOML190]
MGLFGGTLTEGVRQRVTVTAGQEYALPIAYTSDGFYPGSTNMGVTLRIYNSSNVLIHNDRIISPASIAATSEDWLVHVFRYTPTLSGDITIRLSGIQAGNAQGVVFDGGTEFLPAQSEVTIVGPEVISSFDYNDGSGTQTVNLQLDSQDCSTDTDSDGLSDELDIDADNDGIPDNIEAQTTASYIAPSNSDANNNGLDDAYESSGITPVDTDSDMTPDYKDSDADNDGIADMSENGIFEPDSSVNSDADGDGLLDDFDSVDGGTNLGVRRNVIDGMNPNNFTSTWGDLDNDVANDNGDGATPLTQDVNFRDASDDVDPGGPTADCAYVQNFDGLAPQYDSKLYYSLNRGANGQHIAMSNAIPSDASGSGKFLFHNTDDDPVEPSTSATTQGEAWGSPGVSPIMVIPNTLYRLVFKMASNNRRNPPLIDVQINGITLGIGLTPASQRIWETFSVNWFSGSTNTADISLIQTRELSGGLDWGFDEIELCAIRPDIQVTKDDAAASYTPGGTGSYVIRISNLDLSIPDHGVEGVSINDTLPDGVTLSGAWSSAVTSAGAGVVTTGCGSASGGAVGDSAVSLLVDLADGGEVSISVPVQYAIDSLDY